MKRKLFKKEDRLFALAGFCLFGAFVCFGGFLSARQTNPVETVTTAASAATVAETPANIETPPSTEQKSTYVVPADHPRYLSIPSLGIQNARILAVGLDNNNAIKVPANIHDTAWYTGSAKPGQPGALLIDGHVSGPKQPGVFAQLKQLKSGSRLTVETGDGRVLAYTVQAVVQTPAQDIDMHKVLKPYDKAPEGLNLITCGGRFDRAKNAYPDRIIVYATRAT